LKKIALLGCTGSIGVNSLEVVDQMAGEFVVTALSAHRRIDSLYDQAKRFRPQIAAITGATVSDDRRTAFKKLGVDLITGADALVQLADSADYDLLVNAVVGSIGFRPTLTALQRGIPVALANKETMVIGGELVSAAAAHHRAAILPIDSEHSAVFQCLLGETERSVEAVLLTGSGGPFRTLAKEAFASITPAQARKHPNWSMGPKITIDSATMMNKGLEVIEAHWLFQVAVEKIRVVVHPQSIIHSMVLFCDGSIKAQMGLPDMRLPIQLAMTWPERKTSSFPRLAFDSRLSLTFAEPDTDRFPCLQLAYDALRQGGTAPAVLNAANEAAVQLFLEERISFPRIAELVDASLQAHRLEIKPDVEQLLSADRWAREFVGAAVKK